MKYSSNYNVESTLKRSSASLLLNKNHNTSTKGIIIRKKLNMDIQNSLKEIPSEREKGKRRSPFMPQPSS